MFQDLSDGNLFLNSIFDICRSWKDGFPPPVGVIRERYFELKKLQINKQIPEQTKRWESPPAEWIDLKKRLGLILSDNKTTRGELNG